MLKNYFKIALRTLWQHKIYSSINIAGLAVGMAVCILVLLWVQDELNYDRFHDNTKELYRVVVDHEGTWWTGSPWALAPTLKRDFPEIQKCSRFYSRTMVAKYSDNTYYKNGALADEDFLEMFTFPFIRGNSESAFSSVHSVVLTESTAKHMFGSEDPMGKIFLVNNNFQLSVTGIIRDVPSNSHIQFDFIAPVQLLDENWINGWSVESSSYVLLEKNIQLDELRKKIAGIVMKYDLRTDTERTVDLQPITRIHLYNLNGTDPVLNVYIFSTIALFILSIACINYMNLSTARSGSRAKEICMRKVIGAYKRDILRQFYGESFLATFVAMVLSIGLIFLLLPSFNTLSSKQLSFSIVEDWTSFLSLIGIVLITGFFSGSYPAIVLSSLKPLNLLKGSFKSGSYKSNIRRILVIGQFVITIGLIIMTLMMYKQLQFILNRDLGINKENVVILPLNNDLQQNYEAFKNELLQNPNIPHVTCASSIPTSVGNMNPVYWEGKTEDDYVNFNFVSVDYDYFETFGMEMTDGRVFSREFSTDQTNYIINEEAAKLMDLGESPVDKMFSIWTYEGNVIGVVKNFHSRSLHNGLVPIVFTMGFSFAKSRIFVRIQDTDKQEAINFIRAKALEFSPGFPFEYSFLDDSIDGMYTTDEQTGTLFKYFSILAISISCLGILGLASFMAEQRTREIGIRKVLGASGNTIVLLLSKEFIVLVAIANLLAWPVAYYFVNRWLQNYAFHANLDILIFIGAAIFAVFIALMTVSWQAFKAASVNPAESLKYE